MTNGHPRSPRRARVSARRESAPSLLAPPFCPWPPAHAPPFPGPGLPQVKVIEDITEGLENIGRAFNAMMEGGNCGKAVVKVAAHDPFPAARQQA